MINQNWPRWIFASVSKHFDDRRQTIPLYIEGQHRATGDLASFAELRIDGPELTEVSRNYWRLYTEINVLVQAAKNDTNFHDIHRMVGIIAAAFIGITVFKYGDDGSQLGCMKLMEDLATHEKIQISHFGQVMPGTPLLQATVEGHYEMFLKGE